MIHDNLIVECDHNKFLKRYLFFTCLRLVHVLQMGPTMICSFVLRVSDRLPGSRGIAFELLFSVSLIGAPGGPLLITVFDIVILIFFAISRKFVQMMKINRFINATFSNQRRRVKN